MKAAQIICMVEFCRYNNGEGGCVNEFDHVLLEFDHNTAKVCCDTFELIKDEIKEKVNNAK